MRNDATGKAMTVLLVLAMIATVFAVFPASINATGAYEITGTIRDAKEDKLVDVVTVTFTNETLGVNKVIIVSGSFITYLDERADYNVTFEKEGYRTKTIKLLNSTFNDTTMSADLGTILLVPLPILEGTIKELNTEVSLDNVEVTIKNGTTGDVIDTIYTSSGAFSHYVDAPLVDLYYSKNGYYDNMNESVAISDTDTNIGVVYLEKIIPEPTIWIWGIVFEEGTSDRLEGAVVSISKGDDKWITAVTNANGTYEMYAYPGNFQVKASLKGYYTYLSVDDWLEVPKEVRRDIYLEPTPDETLTLSGTVDDGANPVNNADVYLHSTDGQYVNHTTTNVAGAYTMKYYDSNATFKLEVRHTDFYTYVHPSDISDANDTIAVDISLEEIVQPRTLSGVVVDQATDYPIKEATVTLYDTTRLYSNSTSTGELGNYEFKVQGGADLVLIVNADGYQSNATDITALVTNNYTEVKLTPSQKDLINTTYTFVNWTVISVIQNESIEVDNVSIRAEMERKFGMGPLGLDLNNWNLVQGEVDDWIEYLERKSLDQKDTSEFLTLDNQFYELDTASYNVDISGAIGDITTTTSTINITTFYSYTLVGELTDINATVFALTLNGTYDTQTADYTYDIYLPLTPTLYEMTSYLTETINVDVTGYNDPITIDPREFVEDSETVTMTIENSMNGTAKAKIVDGLYYILNSTFDNYEAIVRMEDQTNFPDVDTLVTFSAEDSTDQIGNILLANFTWDFESDGTPDAWGIEVTYNFTTPGEKVVNLTITETGGNKTYRTLTVKVDSQAPTAGISVDVSDDNVTYSAGKVTINEDVPLTFSGVAFSDAEGDVTSSGSNSTDSEPFGILEKWYWSWGEEGVSNETITMEGSNNITHTYSTPGNYTLLMNVTDVVGHVSSDAVWTVNVKDITPPAPDFVLRNATGIVVFECIENQPFSFNASPTTDNYDEIENMTFQWDFDRDGTIDETELNVTYTFVEVDDYNVTVIATDRAGNEKNFTQVVHVSLGERPNLFMLYGTMDFGAGPGIEGEGTAGSRVTISVNITNDGQIAANNVTVTFYIRNADGTDSPPIGTVTTATIEAGGNYTATITWTPSTKGIYTIWANCSTSGEHPSQYYDNFIDNFDVQKITVMEAGWVMPAIIGAVIAVIIVVYFGVRYFLRTRMEAEEGKSGKRKKR